VFPAHARERNRVITGNGKNGLNFYQLKATNACKLRRFLPPLDLLVSTQ
jgi:hypothetical protein